MKTYLDCIPCFIKQSLEAARMATDDETIHAEVLKAVMTHLRAISFSNSPPELSKDVHEIIRNITKSKDPYRKVKDTSNKMAKNRYPYLKKMVEEADDSLLMAVKLAIVGNVIDFGTCNRYNVEDMVANAVKRDFDNGAYPQFKKSLTNAKTILYLADNNGEIFFDKLLLKELLKREKKITYVVRANPIINDATVEDAKFAGIDKLATVIDGDAGQKQSSPGMVLNFASKKFKDLFKESDLVVSKGQGNYEGLSDVDRDVFFMLVVKCPLVARDIDGEVGKLILKVKK
jgi:damage-control phosphatase, subfamily I